MRVPQTLAETQRRFNSQTFGVWAAQVKVLKALGLLTLCFDEHKISAVVACTDPDPRRVKDH